MEEIFTMFDDLKTCYRLKVPDSDAYYSMKKADKNALCLKLREKITDFLGSDSVLFENHLNKVVNDIRSNNYFIKLNITCFNLIKKFQIKIFLKIINLEKLIFL